MIGFKISKSLDTLHAILLGHGPIFKNAFARLEKEKKEKKKKEEGEDE